MPNYSILLIDDEPAIHHAFGKIFVGPTFRLRSAQTGAEGLRAAAEAPPDVVVLDVKLPDESGLAVFEKLRAADARVPVVFITGHGTADVAIEAMKRGAFDYLLKPLELAELKRTVEEAAAACRRMRTPAMIPDDPEAAQGVGDILLGASPKMQEVYKAIGRVAPQNVAVLIRGESGVGKELVARAIYQHSPRAGRPFLAINCAAIPENLLESELFGHERGAFTGADRRRIGRFEQCDGGALFLDEVGEMSPVLQVKLLRVLQEQAFERVGGSETVRTDVRILAATNADLSALVAKGAFRADLFFRLNVFAIHLPPLRERGADIDLLALHFARRFFREFGKEFAGIDAAAFELLRSRPWPGNVRELQSVLKQAALHCRDREISAEDVRRALPGEDAPAPAFDAAGGFDWEAFVRQRLAAGSEEIYAEALAAMEREVIP
ncbi:MAG TPA: sigma-54 dependent transcriptional regulator, partial [Planctomycetia bacterium]|nr:sigma-54 dependent transcriptional regulator [Planctomycetia bacterium]